MSKVMHVTSSSTVCDRAQRRAFTLVELLVVVGIIALLISFLMPSLRKARLAAQNVVCRSNLRQIYLGLAMYAQANHDYIPANNGGAGNWHYRVGPGGHFGLPQNAVNGVYNGLLGPTWAILRCPAEFTYDSPSGLVPTNYEHIYVQSSYAINFAYSYYQSDVPRKGFSKRPPGCSSEKMPMIMDCAGYNAGWAFAMFAWGIDLASSQPAWAPNYEFRHPGRTANTLYMDGHVNGVKSCALGEGTRIYYSVYDKLPNGLDLTIPNGSGGVTYEPYPY
jgi:prepilin-type processing-associated H-X9-DG protein/prepilin-type N-terminal cleavage/methylation domain-containing protein